MNVDDCLFFQSGEVELALLLVDPGVSQGTLYRVPSPQQTHSTISQVRLGQVRLGQVRLGQVRLGQVWFGLVWFGLVWIGLVWFGLVWFGLVWFGLVWFGLVWFGRNISSPPNPPFGKAMFDLGFAPQQLRHPPKLLPQSCHFQNCFLSLCSSFPSKVGKY